MLKCLSARGIRVYERHSKFTNYYYESFFYADMMTTTTKMCIFKPDVFADDVCAV